jgi:hypothetical protein
VDNEVSLVGHAARITWEIYDPPKICGNAWYITVTLSDILHCLKYIWYTNRFGWKLYCHLQATVIILTLICITSDNNGVDRFRQTIIWWCSIRDSRNVVYIKYASDNQQCPSYCSYTKTGFKSMVWIEFDCLRTGPICGLLWTRWNTKWGTEQLTEY